MSNARLWPEPARAVWKMQPLDFQVEELWTLSVTNSEANANREHALLLVEKVGQNTQWVARQLARHAGVRDMDIGFHGLKDRHAVTKQWFSVYFGRRPAPDWKTLVIPGVSILKTSRTHRKLRRGEHQGNRFMITLRCVEGDQHTIFRKLECIKLAGFPNYFGPQRFGRNGNNLQQAAAWFNENKRPMRKSDRSIVLSAARSLLFNRVLEKRVLACSWAKLVAGDEPVNAVSTSGELYSSPSGPLLGGAEFLAELAGEIETSAVAGFESWLNGLHQEGVRTARRSLLAIADNVAWETESNVIKLQFDLSPGVFASVLLNQLFDLQTPAKGLS